MDKQITSDDLIDIEHHFKISAGPGAGKTYWLVNHIKNVLHKSKRLGNAKKICCITYTNNAVDVISNRLGTTSHNVEISTIHSFLYKHIIKPYLIFISKEHGLNIEKVDGHDEEIISSYNFFIELKKRTNQNRIIDNGIIIKAISKAFWKFKDNLNEQLELKIRYPVKYNGYSLKNSTYTTYKTLAWNRGVLHHEDILYFAFDLIKENPFILNILRAKFPYFFVDEFQDSNPIQVEILKMIGDKETIVGLIGDEAQSIYGFQGADVQQFNSFNLNNMQKYKMTQNRRSSNQIINLLNHIRKDFQQQCHKRENFNLPTLHIGEPTNTIKAFKETYKNKSIAIIARTNKEIVSFVRNNKNTNLENNDSNGKRKLYIDKTIKAVNLAKNNNFKEAIKELIKIKDKNNIALDKNQALGLLKKIIDSYDNNKSNTLIEYSNFINNPLNDFNVETTNVSRGNVKDFYSGCIYSDYESFICNKNIDEIYMTIHKTKGCEYENVLLLLENENDLDFLMNPNLANNEEHRINYVAVSRAKNNLWIACPSLTEKNKLKILELNKIISLIA